MSKSQPDKSAVKAGKVAPDKKSTTKLASDKVVPKVAKTEHVNGDHKGKTAAPEAKKSVSVAKPVQSEASKAGEAEARMAKVVKNNPFLGKQRDRLLQLRDNILDSMNGVAKDTLRSRAEGSEASAFGMHQADAGSDAYDRDFALSLLSQEQDALYEIEEALKRIEQGTYGTCEMSGKAIAHARLEAIPFARYTVECQAQIEKVNKMQRSRAPVTSLFGLTDGEEAAETEEEEAPADTKE
jgi:RNA polymerase-binding transcription factor DksA